MPCASACVPSSGLPQRRSLPAARDRQQCAASHRCLNGAADRVAAHRHVISAHGTPSKTRMSHQPPHSLPRYYGPIALKTIPGKGRGLVALGDLAPGDLVLVSLPVAVVFNNGDSGCGGGDRDGGEPEAPSVEALAAAMQRGPRTPAQELLLRLSYDGSAASLDACPDLGKLYSALRRLDSHEVLQGSDGPGEPRLNPDWALRVVELNCFSEPSMDPVMALPPLLSKATAAQGHSHCGSLSLEGVAVAAAAALSSNAASPACAGVGETDRENQQVPASIPVVDSCESRAQVERLAAYPALHFVQLAAGGSGSREGVEGSDLRLDQGPTVSTNSGGSLARARQAESEFGGGDGDGGAGRWLQRPGHTGLWAEHAWMNHSCAPNVCNYVLGEAMVVRTSRPIRYGEEVCNSYLGSTLASPVRIRRRALYEQYGFVCGCPRCLVEEELLGRPLAARLHAAWRLVEVRVTPLAIRLMRQVLKEASACRRGAALVSVSGEVEQSHGAGSREEMVYRDADGSGAEGWKAGEEGWTEEWEEEEVAERDEFEEGEEADALDARLWAEGILSGGLCDATLERASSWTGREVDQEAEMGQQNGAPPGLRAALEGGVLRDTQAPGGAAGGLLSGIALMRDLPGGGGGGGTYLGTLLRLALLTEALSELWAEAEALVRAALQPHCRSLRTDDGANPGRMRSQSGTEQRSGESLAMEGSVDPPSDLYVDWALFCLSGSLDLELACRRVILMMAETAEAEVAKAAERKLSAREAAVHVRNPNGHPGEVHLMALQSWCEDQRTEMAVRRSRLVELAAATAGGTAFHVDATVEDWAVPRRGKSRSDSSLTPGLRHALTCRYGMLSSRKVEGAAEPSCISSGLGSPCHQTAPAADSNKEEEGGEVGSGRSILQAEGQEGELEALLLAELWLKL